LHVRRAREVDRHLAVRDFDLRIADGEPGGVGLDRVGAYRPGGERVAGGGRGRGRQEEAAARQRIDLTCQSFDIGHEHGLSRHTENLSVWGRIRRACDSLSTLAAVFYSGGGSSFTIASMTRAAIGSISGAKNAGRWASRPARDFCKVQRGGFPGGAGAGPSWDGEGV